jgi:hypothetical protein
MDVGVAFLFQEGFGQSREQLAADGVGAVKAKKGLRRCRGGGR